MPDLSTNSIAHASQQLEIGHPQWRLVGPLILLVCQAILLGPLMADYPEIEFRSETLEYEQASLNGVKLWLESDGRFKITSERIELESADRELTEITLSGAIDSVSFNDEESSLQGRLEYDSVKAEFEAHTKPEEFSAVLKMDGFEIEKLKQMIDLPAVANWVSRGHVDAVASYRAATGKSPEISLVMNWNDLAFDSPDGRIAADALFMEVSVAAPVNELPSVLMSGTIRRGELLIEDFYRNFGDGELDFSMHPAWRNEELEIRAIRLTDNHSLEVEASAKFSLQQFSDSLALEINRLELGFPGAYSRYLESAAAAWTLNGLEVTGHISWSGEWTEGAFSSGDLDVKDLTIVDTQRGRFAVTGLNARLRPGDHDFDSLLSWQGLLLGRINLGAARVSLDSEPGVFAIVEPLHLSMLGGRFSLNDLKVILPGVSSGVAGEPDIRLQARLEKLEMEQVTAALGWPSFQGEISGEIPGVRLEGGVLEVDGEIRIDVFDGSVSLGDLRIERPFGVLPSLAGTLEATNLDLEMLTSTFSFGQISGRLDGFVHDLRMLDWQPVAFDAWFGTPLSQSRSKGISRQAVNHLTTLGGGSATAALTGPILRMFNNFSYRRLGLGCRMQNNVCDVRGVSEDEVSVLLMEGAGVPKITIRAFNRRVDWPQMVAHLKAATGGESVRIGD
jgi:hypothetical protein